MKMSKIKLLLLLMLIPLLGGCYTQFAITEPEPIVYRPSYYPLYSTYTYVDYVGLIPFYHTNRYWPYYNTYYVYTPKPVVRRNRSQFVNRSRVITPTRSTFSSRTNRQTYRASTTLHKEKPQRNIIIPDGQRSKTVRRSLTERPTVQKQIREQTRSSVRRTTPTTRSTVNSSNRGTSTNNRSTTRSRTTRNRGN